MTLKEYMEAASEGTMYYIGSSVGFLMIVTKEEFETDLPCWETNMYEKLQRRLMNNVWKMRAEPKMNAIYEDKSVKFGYTLRDDIAKRDKELDKLSKRIRELLKMITGWVPLADRKVKETYNRDTGGVAVLIEGEETGDFWFREEYTAWKEGNGMPVASEVEEC